KIKGEKAGVFIGVSSFDYSHLNFSDINKLNMYSVTGSALSVTANRLSYLFDLKGPSIAIDTACSSSLTAIHLACQSIANNESSIAIVGGVNLIISPSVLVAFSQAQTTSPDGKCKAFDADANGMVRGEGGGIVILKPIEKAIQDNDYIYGIIKGSAVNQDGLTNGLSAPSPAGQRAVLEQAYNNANIDPNLVDFVETHGTGTVLGDPIEADALGKVLGNNRTNTCKIGSVKTNIGHLEASAGIAGFIKTVLCLDKKYLVPSLHFKKPNPYINFEKLNLEVQTKVEKIEKEKVIAGVSSFGFGGTNAHVVIESFDFEFWTSQNDNSSLISNSIQNDL
ncbi:MAG: beta-ketoacyl synthase N-terminal-like domain-containing protein, partial [Candidatus Sericytochromatia bacterium]